MWGFLVKGDFMKTGKLLTVLGMTSVVVTGASVFSGMGVKNRQVKKEQSNLVSRIKQTGISDDEFAKIKALAELEKVPHKINDVYKEALASLELKAQYEKVQLQTISSLKKVVQNDDSIKMLTKSAV